MPAIDGLAVGGLCHDIGRKYGGRSEYKDIDSDSVSLPFTFFVHPSKQVADQIADDGALASLSALSPKLFLLNNSPTKAHFVMMVASEIARTITWVIRFF